MIDCPSQFRHCFAQCYHANQFLLVLYAQMFHLRFGCNTPSNQLGQPTKRPWRYSDLLLQQPQTHQAGRWMKISINASLTTCTMHYMYFQATDHFIWLCLNDNKNIPSMINLDTVNIKSRLIYHKKSYRMKYQLGWAESSYLDHK